MAWMGNNPVWGPDPGAPQAQYGGGLPAGANHYGGNGTYTHQTNVGGHAQPMQYAAGDYRQPGPYPVIDAHVPAAQLRNSTGGVGCEPGYTYFFPSTHTKIHVLRTGGTPPWQIPAHHSFGFSAIYVPTMITVKQFLQGVGANNATPKLNTATEVFQSGDGKWRKGMTYSGADSDTMSKTIEAIGWDTQRSGLPGKPKVVYLYITRG